MADPLASLPPEIQMHRVLTTEQAAEMCGYGVTRWRALVKAGEAPPPIKLSARKYGWKVGALIAWLNSKTAAAGEVAA